MNGFTRSLFLSAVIVFLSLACSFPGLSSNQEDEKNVPLTPTATKTTISSGPLISANQCDDLTGQLEVFVMAGPGAAVGLEPFALGSFPISTTNQNGTSIVSGGGPATYYDILTRDWGTYEVFMDLDIEITGTCNTSVNPGSLDLTVTMSGTQNVIVEAEGLSGEYPWEGTANVMMILPISEGAIASGEGWKCILHPDL